MFDERKIIEAITGARAPVNLARLVRLFHVKAPERRAFRSLLHDLESRGVISRVSGKNYTAPTARTSSIIGRIEVTSKGFGFVRPDWGNVKGPPPFEGDLFIPVRDMGDALDGDLVRAELMRRGEEGASGRVTTVIEHAHQVIVGRYQQAGRHNGEVIPRNTRLERRIRVPLPAKGLEVKDLDWVEVEIDKFTSPPDHLVGHITSRIGSDGDRGIDVLLILRDRGIVEEFPASVEEEVKHLRFAWDEDMKGRKDYRKLPTITIDPKTAKDYDDGLSVEVLPEGGWRLYVHIADVAHFVRSGTALDNEALDRSTSVYPVDRVVPMLPKKLSNYLCSLVPNEDRLTMTSVMEIGPTGRLLSKKIHSSAIHSDYRMTYEQVQSAFDATDGKPGLGESTEPFKELLPMLAELRTLARALRKTRFTRGALDLDIPQLTVIFDEHGSAADLKFYPRYESHQLVEECMLIANEAVAQFLTEKKAPLLYRVHEVADQERLEKLEPALKLFGISLMSRGEITPLDIQKALVKAQEHPAGHIVRRLILRALKRAVYDPENAGHFGLASECYCHFTSPIRRYPDVIVHRQLKALESNSPLPYAREENDLDELGEHTSSRERRAQEAEWESTTIKSLEFMKKFEGQEFTGYIASLQSWGIYVELEEYPVEGFVKKISLAADKYELDDTGVKYVGRLSGHVIKLADKVRVRIDKIDALAQRLDLTLLDQPDPPKGLRSPAKARREAPPEKKRGAPKRGRR